MKKAQGLSLNTIVIAALVLIVLIIAIAILGGTSGKVLPFFGKQTTCEGRGGQCLEQCTDTKIYGISNCDERGKKENKAYVCCVNQQG